MHRVRRLFVSTMIASAMLVPGVVAPASASTQTEGSLDPSFGYEGQLLDLKSGGFGGFDVAVQSDGKLVVAEGEVVVRYTPTGHLDPTFGSAGVVTFGAAYGLGSVALQRDGKILVAGNELRATYDMVVVRLKPDGTRDTTFNSTGPHPGEVAQSVGTGVDSANDVAVQPDGKILLAGYSTSANPDNVVVRYLPNGQPDGGFGTGGIVNLNFTANEHFYGVATGPSGTVIATGDYQSTSDGTEDVEVVRLTSGGDLDSSFDSDGVQTTSLSAGNDAGNDVVVGHGGEIFVAASGGGTAQVIAYTSGGALDTNFGTGGEEEFAANPTAAANAIVIERDGKLVAAGSTGADFAVARMSQAGVLDPHFSGDGVAQFGFGKRNNVALGVALQRDGKLVVAGYSQDPASGGDIYPALVRVIGDATPPSRARLDTLPRFALARAVTLRMHATDDNAGVASYQVRERAAPYGKSTFGPWRTLRSRATGSKLAVKVLPGNTYCFDARARDQAGNVGALGAETCTAAPADDRVLTLGGGWTRAADSAAYHHTVSRTTAHGATASLPVAFRHVELVATKCPSCGMVQVYLGSHLVKTFDLKAATTRHRVQLVVESSARIRSQTLRIVVASSGRTVTLDGIGVSLA